MGEQDVARKPFDIVVCGPSGRIRPAATTSTAVVLWLPSERKRR